MEFLKSEPAKSSTSGKLCQHESSPALVASIFANIIVENYNLVIAVRK